MALKWGIKSDYHSNNDILLKLDYIQEESSGEIPEEVYDISNEYLEHDEITKLLNYFIDNNQWQDYYTSYQKQPIYASFKDRRLYGLRNI